MKEEKWVMFIKELRVYIEEHHLGPSKHTTLYNQCRYFKRKLKEGELDEEKAKELEDVLSMRDLTIHTGGRRKQNLYKPLADSGSIARDCKGCFENLSINSKRPLALSP